MEELCYNIALCLFFSGITGLKDCLIVGVLALPITFLNLNSSSFLVFFSVIAVRLLMSASSLIVAAVQAHEGKNESLEFATLLLLYSLILPNLNFRIMPSEGFELFKTYFNLSFIFILPTIIFMGFLNLLLIIADKISPGSSLMLKPVKAYACLLLVGAMIVGLKKITG